MKKKSLIIKIVVFVLLASIAIAGGAFLAVNVLQNQKAGNKANVEWYDEEQEKFTISSVEELYDLASLSDFYDFEGQTILLGADIVFNDGDATEWNQKVPKNQWTGIRGFAGTFDGQGHTISGLYGRGIDVSMGLFADTTAKAKIKNLKILNSYFEADGNYPVGSVAANGSGTFEKIYSDAILVSNGECIGGIIGETNPTSKKFVMGQQTRISNCWFDGEIRMKTVQGRYGGGITGKISDGSVTIEHCLNSASITCESNHYGGVHVGGICGSLRSGNYTSDLTIRDCLNTGKITTKSLGTVGAIVGRTYTKTQMVIDNVYGTLDSCKNIWHLIEGTSNGVPMQLEEKYIVGNGGFEWTELDFNNYWALVNEGTPILQAFAKEIPSIAGLKKAYNVDWYDESAKEYTLRTLEDLRGFAILAQSKDFAKKTVKLGADIVMNEGDAKTWGQTAPEYEWTPIGWTAEHTAYKKFAGTFDGQGHTISGMYISASEGAVGLFGNVVECTIKNLKITNSYIESTIDDGWAMVGSVAGLGYGVFDTIYSDAIVVAKAQYAGGILGMMNESAKPDTSKVESKIINCWFDGEVQLKGDKAVRGGGILGGTQNATCTVAHCLNTGSLINDAKAENKKVVYMGGMVGSTNHKNDALTIEDCLSVGKMTTKGSKVGVGSVFGFADNGTMVVEDAYASEESFETTGVATLKGGNGFFTVPEKELLGTKGYANTMLNFNTYWAAVSNKTPMLKSFATSSLSVKGVARLYNTDWYDINKKTYELKSVADFRGFAEMVKNIDFKGETIKLATDITLNTGNAKDWATAAPANVWTPIGWTSEHTSYKKFAGTFDGQGHTISGIYVSTSEGGAGLFGNVVDCTIKNLKITNSYIESTIDEGWAMVGSVAGLGYGVFDTIYSDAIVVAKAQYAGGILGMMNESAKPADSKFESKITNCWYAGELQLQGDKAIRGGGILGGLYNATCEVSHCLNTGGVNSDTNEKIGYLGGIVGTISQKKDKLRIEDCLNVGTVTSKKSKAGIGSIFGFADNGKVVGQNTYATEESCHSTGGTNLSDGNGFFTVLKDNLLGTNGYANSMLDFYIAQKNADGYWVAVNDATPSLRSFAGDGLDVSKVARLYNTDWYDADKKTYEIKTVAEFRGFAEMAKNFDFKGKTIKLAADITLNEGEATDWATKAPENKWTPIGWTTAHSEYKKFAGTFDGQGHSISGIYCKEDVGGVGLFGNLENATIKNLKIVNSYFETTLNSGWGLAGSVAGLGYGTFESIYSDAILVNGAEYTGGIIGRLYNEGSFTNCEFAGNIQMKGENAIRGGGIVGSVEGKAAIEHCLNSGQMLSERSKGVVYLGGICGSMKSDLTMTDCLSVGTILPGTSTAFCGSILGGADNGEFTASKTYGLVEGYGSLGAYDATNATLAQLKKGELIDVYGYLNTALNFYDKKDNKSGYWVAIKDSVPQLRSFATGKQLDITGVVREVDTSWYIGHENDTEYTIDTVAELRGMAELLKSTTNFAGKTIYLGANITWNEGEDAQTWATKAPVDKWTPMGWTGDHTNYMKFAGTFDGQGYEISGLYVKKNMYGIGLFGNIDGATVKNLKITNSYFESTSTEVGYVGTIAGLGYGTFDSIYSDAFLVNGHQYTGGFIGRLYNTGTFTNCWFAGQIQMKGSEGIRGGGIVGAVEAACTINHCLNSGTLQSERTSDVVYMGGLCGSMKANLYIKDSLSVGDILPGGSKNFCGSIVGGHDNGTFTAERTYAMTESYSSLGAYATTYTDIKQVKEDDLKGVNAYKNTLLNFYIKESNETGYWVAIKDGTPLLRTFADSKRIESSKTDRDISWYDDHENDTSYTLHNLEDLNGFAELLKTTTDFAGKTIYLGSDIALNTGNAKDWATEAPEKEWTPMGWTATHTEYKQFAGTLDGQGHSISGLYVKEELSGVGLFGYIANAKIQNLKITNSYFESTINSSWVYMGSVAGIGYGTFTNVYSDAILVNGGEMTGGLIGRVVTANNTAFTKCWFDGEIHLRGANGKVGGGFVGSLEKDAGLTDCLMSGTIDCEATGEVNVGGLIGKRTSSNLWLTRTMVTGDVIPKGASYSKVGALVGNSSASVYCNYAVFTNESYSGGMGSFSVTGPGQLPLYEADLYGQSAVTKLGTQFDFTNTWQAVEGNTPIIKGLHEGKTREIRTSWYIGHESDTSYTISTLADLQGMSELLKFKTDFAGKTIYLSAGITLNEGDAENWATNAPAKEWTPMGWTATHTEYKQFAGTLDGQGHSISGLYVKEELSGVGLFGYIANAKIQNLKITNSYFESTINSSWVYMGSVAGIGYGTFTNVYSDAILVNGGEMTGGLIGRVVTANNTAFTKCWFDGEIHLRGANGKVGGGFVGSLEKDAGLTDCLMSGTIDCEATGDVNVGGLIGKRTSSNLWLTRTMVTGDVIPKGASYSKVGALVGNSSASVYCDYAVFTNESYSGGMGSFSVTGPGQLPVKEADLYGQSAETKLGAKFDFNNVWKTVEDATPILR